MSKKNPLLPLMERIGTCWTPGYVRLDKTGSGSFNLIIVERSKWKSAGFTDRPKYPKIRVVFFTFFLLVAISLLSYSPGRLWDYYYYYK